MAETPITLQRDLDADTLNATIAELMEPRATLLACTVQEARRLRWGPDESKWVWYSVDPMQSPDGWWEAELGTDAPHDDTPLRWYPAREPESDLAAAWLVVDELNDGKFLQRYPEFITAIQAQRALFDTVEGWLFSMGHSDVARSICLAALAAIGAASPTLEDPTHG